MIRPIVNKLNTWNPKQLCLALVLSLLTAFLLCIILYHIDFFVFETPLLSFIYQVRILIPLHQLAREFIYNNYYFPYLFLIPSYLIAFQLIKAHNKLIKILAMANFIILLLMLPIYYWLFVVIDFGISCGLACSLFNQCLITVD
jgi:hypothetical protein